MTAHKTNLFRGGPPNFYYEWCVSCGKKKGLSQSRLCSRCGHAKSYTTATRNHAIWTLYIDGVSTSTIARAFRLTRAAIQKIIREWKP